jgi:cell fate regulator YaaT (PSP1 superfamily)
MDLKLRFTTTCIDFRALIKDFAKEFSTRIEMKQVGFRQKQLVWVELVLAEEIVLFYLVDGF